MFDTDVLKLINELSKKGIYLWEEQGRLKYKCKKEKISEEILNELRVKKAEIVEFLQKCGSNSFPVSPLPFLFAYFSLICINCNPRYGITNLNTRNVQNPRKSIFIKEFIT